MRDLFKNAARGLFAYLLIEGASKEKFCTGLSVRGIDAESLLVSWLSELLYVSTQERVLPDEFHFLELTDTVLRAEVCGRRIPDGYHTAREIKAVTYHELKIRRTKSGFQAKIIFDV